ncbi:MAG: phosphatase PAP2 family protein [Candidatus Cyclobacteriaceae bacterium M3_2C_046]
MEKDLQWRPNQKLSLIIYLGLILTGALLMILFEKGHLVLLLNQHRNAFLDVFFIGWTFLGDGLMFLILVIIFLFIRLYWVVLTALTALVQTVMVHLFKQWLFEDLARPKRFFEGLQELNFIPGVDVHSSNSFPSGHTATAFAVATILILVIRSKFWSVGILFAAILVGISRIYLLQHFFIDIYFGSAFGLTAALVTHLFLVGQSNLNMNHVWQRPVIRTK